MLVKTILLFIGICSSIIAFVVMLFVIVIMINNVDTSFATEVRIKYEYNDKNIALTVTDENDIMILKDNLNGIAYSDYPSCGFSLDTSVTFADGKKSIVLCPACDNCSVARIGSTGKYIIIKDRQALEAVLAKYGMTFPCV